MEIDEGWVLDVLAEADRCAGSRASTRLKSWAAVLATLPADAPTAASGGIGLVDAMRAYIELCAITDWPGPRDVLGSLRIASALAGRDALAALRALIVEASRGREGRRDAGDHGA